MKLSANLFEQIDRYLNNRLEGDALRQFEDRLKKESDLAQEVDFQRNMKDLLAGNAENDLRKTLEQVSADFTEIPPGQTGFGWRKFYWLLPIVLLAAGLWLLRDDSPAVEPTISQPETSEINASAVMDTVLNDEKIEEDTVAVSPVEEPKIQKKKIKPVGPNLDKLTPKEIEQYEKDLNEPTIEIDFDDLPKGKRKFADNTDSNATDPIGYADQKDRLIAANFDPNPSIEFYIDSNMRSLGLALEIESKPKDFQINSEKGSVAFNLSGRIDATENVENKKLLVHLFSNRSEEFDDFLPISTSDLQVKGIGDGAYSFNFSKNYVLAPGLYYIILEDGDKEQILHVEKFKVTEN